MDVINVLDMILHYIFPYRSGNHQAKIAINSFTAWVFEQALQTRIGNSYIIHEFGDMPIDWSKIVAIRTPHNNILHIEKDDSLKNMEVKIIK